MGKIIELKFLNGLINYYRMTIFNGQNDEFLDDVEYYRGTMLKLENVITMVKDRN